MSLPALFDIKRELLPIRLGQTPHMLKRPYRFLSGNGFFTTAQITKCAAIWLRVAALFRQHPVACQVSIIIGMQADIRNKHLLARQNMAIHLGKL